jgi:hypothetical protein
VNHFTLLSNINTKFEGGKSFGLFLWSFGLFLLGFGLFLEGYGRFFNSFGLFSRGYGLLSMIFHKSMNQKAQLI